MTISANQQTFSFNVTIINDNVLELFEIFGLGLEVMGFPRIDVESSIVNAQISINDVDSKCLMPNQLYINKTVFLTVDISIGFNQSVYIVNEQATDIDVGFSVVVFNGSTSIPIFVDSFYKNGSAIGLYYVLYNFMYYY